MKLELFSASSSEDLIEHVNTFLESLEGIEVISTAMTESDYGYKYALLYRLPR